MALKDNAKCLPIARTGRVQDWIDDPDGRLPVSCTVFVVQDSMEGEDGIEDSWAFVSHALRNGAGVAIHLSKLRPKGTDNGKGLVSSGPVSFGMIYSKLNEVLRRGGKFKNGAVVLHLDYDHPDAMEFISAPRKDFQWAKRCVNVDDNFIEKSSPEFIAALTKAITQGDVWLMKMRTDHEGARIYGNVCVAGDTLVHTTEGPLPIASLVGKQFTAIVDGQGYESSPRGAWSNGFRPTHTLETKEGFSLRATFDHKIMTSNGWRKLGELRPGDVITLNQNQAEAVQWSGRGNHDEGWLLGWLLADGCYAGEDNTRLDFYGEKQSLLDGALQKLSGLDHYLHVNRGSYGYGRTGFVGDNDRASVNSVGLARMAVSYGVTQASKKANELVEMTSSEFHAGFLQAYFSADGTVNLGRPNGSGKSIGVTSISLANLQVIQRMLLRFGIRSRIWKNRYNGKPTLMNDGNGGQKMYETKPASRLDISGQKDIARFAQFVGFSLSAKQEKLDSLLDSYRKTAYSKRFEATVSTVTAYGVEGVFDCSIPGLGAFDANGIYVSNCLEVLLPHRGTCLLQHVNLGALKPEEFHEAFVNGMKELCELHGKTGVEKGGHYLPPVIDRQVGLGILGLANCLAINGITYAELADALDAWFEGDDASATNPDFKDWSSLCHTKAATLVVNLNHALEQAAEVAESYNMARAFAIAPTASCAYRYLDAQGFTTAPELAPPIARLIDRDSSTFGVESFDHGSVEIASEVGWEVYKRVANGIVRMYEATGLFHGYSYNWWSDMTKCDEAFLKDWLESPQTSLYYALPVMPNAQAKDDAFVALDDDFKELFGLDEEQKLEQQCTSCSE